MLHAARQLPSWLIFRRWAKKMKWPAIILQVLMLSSCSHLSVPSIADGGTLVTMTEENKFLLESGRSAFVDLGRKRGWLKIALVKHGWDHGTVTVFFSRTGEFAGDQQPYRIYVDELDPCLIDLKEFDVTIALTAGTKSASHIELLWGSASRLFHRKSEEPNKAPEPTPGLVTSCADRFSERMTERKAQLAPSPGVAHL